MKRYILHLSSLLLLSGLIAGCSFATTDSNENSKENEAVEKADGNTSDSSNENSTGRSGIDIL